MFDTLAPDTSLELRSLVEFQDSIIDIPGHPCVLGENNFFGIQISFESPTDMHGVGLNIAGDDRLSPKRERAASTEPSTEMSPTPSKSPITLVSELIKERWTFRGGASVLCSRSGMGSGVALAAASLGG